MSVTAELDAFPITLPGDGASPLVGAMDVRTYVVPKELDVSTLEMVSTQAELGARLLAAVGVQEMLERIRSENLNGNGIIVPRVEVVTDEDGRTTQSDQGVDVLSTLSLIYPAYGKDGQPLTGRLAIGTLNNETWGFSMSFSDNHDREIDIRTIHAYFSTFPIARINDAVSSKVRENHPTIDFIPVVREAEPTTNIAMLNGLRSYTEQAISKRLAAQHYAA